MSYFDNFEKSEGDRGVRGLGEVLSCHGVVYGIRGVERRLRRSVFNLMG